ncbi:hypothetical protein ACFXAF_32570 [Kitasatospora sp. NPDC059463]
MSDLDEERRPAPPELRGYLAEVVRRVRAVRGAGTVGAEAAAAAASGR